MALEDEDIEVIEAENGAIGLELAKTENIDLIITDLLMPEKEGIETIRELRQRDTETPVIALPVQERNIFVIPSLDGATTPVISPDELPGLQLWLQSDEGVTYDSDGVSQWSPE